MGGREGRIEGDGEGGIEGEGEGPYLQEKDREGHTEGGREREGRGIERPPGAEGGKGPVRIRVLSLPIRV